MSDEGPRISQPARWHRSLAAVVGDLSMAIAKRKMSASLLREWAKTLRMIAGEMDDTAG